MKIMESSPINKSKLRELEAPKRKIAESIFAMFCASLAAWIVLSATARFGAGVTSDSVFYLSSADHIRQGIGIIDFKNDPLKDFPPLYPLILAILSGLSGITSFLWGRFLNAGATAAIVLSTALLLKRCFPNWVWSYYYGVLATLLLFPIYPLAANICTDMLYILFSLWFCLAAQNFLLNKGLSWLILMTFLAVATTMLRWVGLTLSLALAGLVLYKFWSNKIKALAYSLALGILASLPVGLWIVVHNYWLHGKIGRVAGTGHVDVYRNLQLTIQRLSEWFSPDPLRFSLPIIFLVLIVILLRNRRSDWHSWLQTLVNPILFPIFLLSGIYFLAILFTGYTLDHLRSFDHRYQVPLFFVILIMILSALQKLILDKLKKPARIGMGLVMLAAFCAWSSYQTQLISRFIDVSQQEGVQEYNDYNLKKWGRSELVTKLIRNPPEASATLYSNEPEMVYFFLGRNTFESPTDPGHYYADLQALMPRYAHWPPDELAYWIWFKPNTKRDYYPPEALEPYVEMEWLYKSWNGELYRIERLVDND